MKFFVVALCFTLTCVLYPNCRVEANSLRRRKRMPIYVVEYNKNEPEGCPEGTGLIWASDFHECFIDRKYSDGGRDLKHIVDRILGHVTDCIETSKKPCRPNYKEFMVIIEKVLNQTKDYTEMYLEAIFKDRDKIYDLECVEKELSVENYKECFEDMTDESEELFRRDVEKAISCINSAHRRCSTAAKISLNRMARKILDVPSPEEENIEVVTQSPPPPPPPPKRWYDYILDPLKSMWRAIKSFFGF